MEMTLWMLLLGGTLLGWLILATIILWKYGFAKFVSNAFGVFEGEEKEDPRWSFGRVFSFLFLLPAFAIIGYTVFKFQAGAGWQIFIGSGIAIIAALLPYLITKASEVIAIIEALKTKNQCGGK